MVFLFDSDEKQNKQVEGKTAEPETSVKQEASVKRDAPRNAAARGLSRLRAGLRKSDTQELDYREVAEKQAQQAAEKKRTEQAAAEEAKRIAAEQAAAEERARLAAEKRQAEQAAAARQAEAEVQAKQSASQTDAALKRDTVRVEHKTRPDEAAADPAVSNVQESLEEDTRSRERRILKKEIASLQQALQNYGFGFAEMRDAAPKSDKLREQCREVTCVVLHEGMMEGLRRDHRLPLKAICDDLDIPAIKIEEHKKYIIAVCEILDGDYPYLSEFLGETRERLHQTSRLYHRG